MAGLRLDFPRFICVRDLLDYRVSLKNESGTGCHLRDRSECAEVPDGSRDDVTSRSQERAEIEGFVSPVAEITAGRAFADPCAVDKENEAIVRADMQEKFIRQDGQ